MKWVKDNFITLVMTALLAYIAFLNQKFIDRQEKVEDRQSEMKEVLDVHVTEQTEQHRSITEWIRGKDYKDIEQDQRITNNEKEILILKHRKQ